MSALGTHLILELHGCETSKLNDVEFIRSVLIEAANEANATIVGEVFHEFSPIGVTGVVAIAESHISIHSWPEHEYAAIDMFMCGETEPHRAGNVIRNAFQPERGEIGEHQRGRL